MTRLIILLFPALATLATVIVSFFSLVKSMKRIVSSGMSSKSHSIFCFSSLAKTSAKTADLVMGQVLTALPERQTVMLRRSL